MNDRANNINGDKDGTNNNGDESEPPPPSSYNNVPEPTEDETIMTEKIAKDRPLIDQAVKSFISMTCARSMMMSGGGTSTSTSTGNSPISKDTTTTNIDDSAATTTTGEGVMMGIIPSLTKTSISSSVSSSPSSLSTAPPSSTYTTHHPTTTTSTSTPLVSIQQQVLDFGRCILKAVNTYTFPIHDTVAYSLADKPGTTPAKKQELLQLSVVARLFNALIDSKKKPSQFLGRKSLRLVWNKLNIRRTILQQIPHGLSDQNADSDSNIDLDTFVNNIDDHPIQKQQLLWLEQFETLLFFVENNDENDDIDNDSALLWSPDGGAAELSKRRQRRFDAAKERG